MLFDQILDLYVPGLLKRVGKVSRGELLSRYIATSEAMKTLLLPWRCVWPEIAAVIGFWATLKLSDSSGLD